MTRALSLACVSLLVVAGTTRAEAGNKSSVGVLGLEVFDPNGAPTPADAQVGKELTDGLRQRAKAGTGPYQLQPGSEKELIDEKLLKNCDNEALGCMSQIGTELGADVLVYGRIEKKGGAYEVTVTLLDVRNRQLKKHVVQIPLAQAQGAQIQSWAKNIYNKLTGQADTGQITIRISNSGSGDLRGTIKVDNEDRGNINNGTGTVTGVSPGKHTITVVVGGYRLKDVNVTVIEGQNANIPVEVEKDEGGGPPPPPYHPPGTPVASGSNTWRNIMWGSLGVGALGGGFWIVSYVKLLGAEQTICENGGYLPMSQGGTYVGTPPVSCTVKPAAQRSVADATSGDGQAWSTRSYIGIAVTATGAGFAIFSYIMSRQHQNNERSAQGHRVHHDDVVVTPVITPDGAGATLRFDF